MYKNITMKIKFHILLFVFVNVIVKPPKYLTRQINYPRQGVYNPHGEYDYKQYI